MTMTDQSEPPQEEIEGKADMKPAAHLLFCILAGASLSLAGEAATEPSARNRPQAPPWAIERPTGPVSDRMIDEHIPPAVNTCPQSLVDEVLKPALDSQGRLRPSVGEAVEIDCNLTLQPEDVVTRRLVMTGPDASGVTIDCNGATIRGEHWLRDLDSPGDTILVRAREVAPGDWRGAENITVKDCRVHGSVRVYGIATKLSRLRGMSYETDYTETLQEAGSKNIVFANMEITAYRRNPFYVEDGVTRVTLMNSRIRGRSNGVAIYLDAESAENVIKDNDIGVINSREQIALDGSARNLIVGNRLSGLNTGGIYLYRNCGEDGIIRHQGAEDNVIIDNVFYYDRYHNVFDYVRYWGRTPAVWVASRQNNLPGYCNEDDRAEAPKIGSNLDHLDHAYRNVVAHNRFIARAPEELIRVHGDPSYVFGNLRVSAAGDRNSPCYVANGYPAPIIEHGESLALFDDGEGPRCNGRRLSCVDGLLRESAFPCPQLLRRVSIVPFECRAEGRNGGCATRAACPGGSSIASVKAACNLEFGAVSPAQLASTPWSLAGVVKRSDHRDEGVCRLGRVDVSENGAELGALSGAFGFSCREHDRNGGDCHVRGALACQSSLPVLDRLGAGIDD